MNIVTSVSLEGQRHPARYLQSEFQAPGPAPGITTCKLMQDIDHKARRSELDSPGRETGKYERCR
jgi:hypothetical protein